MSEVGRVQSTQPHECSLVQLLTLGVDACRKFLTVCMREKAAVGGCPDVWSLTTTDDLRTHLSFLDIVPSALESRQGNESAMFLNHDLLGMFKAMAAHKSQSRWCETCSC